MIPFIVRTLSKPLSGGITTTKHKFFFWSPNFAPWDFFMVFRAISRLCDSPKDPIKIKVLYREGIANITRAVMWSVRQTPANGLLIWLGGGGVNNPI